MSDLSAGDFFNRVPKIKPLMNVGCLMDIPTGRYYQGKDGEMILNGGVPGWVGVCGKPNTYKSTLSHFLSLRCYARYSPDFLLIQDTEGTIQPIRLEHLASKFEELTDIDLDQVLNINITGLDTFGDVYFDQLKKFLKAKMSNKKKSLRVITPFIDGKGENISIIRPTIWECDSLSRMRISAVDAKLDKAKAGASENNTEAMREGAAKSQIINVMPDITSRSGLYAIMTAHLDHEIKMDPYAPDTRRLATMKKDTKLSRVPKPFAFLTDVIYQCTNPGALKNQSDKTPLWPRDDSDRGVNDNDLQKVTVETLRSKYGRSGGSIEIVLSQEDGMEVQLTMWNHIKERKYGYSGNDVRYSLDLVPDIQLQRTTLRGLFYEHRKLERALEISADLCQIQTLWKNIPEELNMTPKEIYEGLKQQKIDVDKLLETTRNYWLPKELEKDCPYKFLSTYDICRLAKGTFTPKWMREGK